MTTGQLLRETRINNKMPDDIEPCPTCLGHAEICANCDQIETLCECTDATGVKAFDPVLCWECNGVGVVAEAE